MIKDIEEYPWSEELQCRYMSWIAEDITTLILRTPDEYNKCDIGKGRFTPKKASNGTPGYKSRRSVFAPKRP